MANIATLVGTDCLLRCKLCGAKVTVSGSIVNGNGSCNCHDFESIPIISRSHPRDGRQLLTSPEPELVWLRTLAQNRKECESHCEQFQKDVNQLHQRKIAATHKIQSVIQQLKAELDKRQQQLEQQLDEAFEERRQKICTKIKILGRYKSENQNIEDHALEILAGSAPVGEKQKIIVEHCRNIIDKTPVLTYVDTELHHTFDSMDRIQQYLSEFGCLHSKPIDCAIKCKFDSKRANKSKSPKKFVMPITRLKSVLYDDNTRRIKVIFTISNSSEDLIAMDQYLKVHVLCAEIDDDIDYADGIFHNPIHEEHIPLDACHHLSIHSKQRSQKSSLVIGKIFYNSGGTHIAIKIRMVFDSPDDTKYENARGDWSRVMSVDVSETIPKQISVIAKRCLWVKKRILMRNSQYNMAFMRERLMLKFKLNNEFFDIKRDYDDGLIQMDADILSLFEYRDVSVIPYTETLLFGFVRSTGCINISDDIIRMIFHWFSGHPKFRTLGNSWNSWRQEQTINVEENDAVHVVERANLPRRICVIVQFDNAKKRIVLKNNAHAFDFTMDALIANVMRRYQKRGLAIPFTMTTDDGDIIQSDDDIVNYLAEFEGVVEITQSD